MTDTSPPIDRSSRRVRLPARYAAPAFAFYMAGIIAFLMSLVLTAFNTGLSDGYMLRVLKAYALAMPTAFACVMLVRPLVVWLVARTVAPPGGSH